MTSDQSDASKSVQSITVQLFPNTLLLLANLQLIEDKKKLGEKCEKLVKELRETSSKYQTKVKTMEET